MSARQINVVPHTHWDREWYEPFQTFRLKLVDLLDHLIPLLESDPSYARYLLDGQMAVVDDYLEVRPEMEDRLRRLAASGRVAMGPWYILVDEFLVTGETIIRDLQLGMEKGAAFGGVTSVGYLPDMFGHIAQMPQILQLAGFADTVLWRGVPSAVTKSGFNWVAPNGSSVRAEYLVTGYGNGASLPDDAKALVRRVADHINDIGEFLLGDLLFMNGSDHLMPQAHLGRVLTEANEIQDDFHFVVTSLAEHIARAPREGLETWRGELRSGYRSNILMGVLSNRIDVKKATALVERHLERRAEPYSALFVPAAKYPDALLRVAWREVIRNAAHDSICACSVDETVDAVLHRFNEARAISVGLADRALSSLAGSFAEGGVYVVNPSAAPRSGLVEAIVDESEFDPARMQVVAERTTLPDAMTLDVDGMNTILSVVQDNRIDDTAWVHEVSLGGDNSVAQLVVHVGPREKLGVDLATVRQELLSKMGANPDLQIELSLVQPAIRRVVGHVVDVPGFGWKPFAPITPSHPVVRDGYTLRNGLVSIAVDSTTGTFSVNGLAGYGQLVDEGDLGDSYNYSPPRGDSVVAAPVSVAVTPLSDGPLTSSLRIESTYEIPSHIDEDSHVRTGSITQQVVTTVELRANDATVFVTTSFTNAARDHRLRVLLPLPRPAATSTAECAFTTVTRGLTAEGRSEEFGLPTFPSRRFVAAGGLTVVHEGINEYELVNVADGHAHAMALTLLRATGMLSRIGMALRPLPAGPLTPVEGLQMLGRPLELHYGLTVDPVDPYTLADHVLAPFDSVASNGGGHRKTEGTALEIAGAVVSAVRRVGGQLEVRVFNPTPEPTSVQLPDQRGWIVDLRGQAVRHFEGSFNLQPFEICTFVLTDVTQ